mgnify:CR=1 FL=1
MDVGSLVTKLKQGEESAYKELVLNYSRRLMTVAKIYSRNEEEAKDILQDAFVLVFRKIEIFKGHEEAALYGWMKRMVINLCLSRNQKKYRKMESSMEIVVHDKGIQADAINNLSHAEIMEMVFNLPEGYKQVFALYAVEGFSHKEIAQVLGIKESSSRSQYSRARKILQSEFHNLIKVMTA